MDLMTDHAIVEFANDAFYTAFATRDIEAMNALWSHATVVCCIHPGWEPLTGIDSVLESWAAILASEGSPDIRVSNPVVRVHGAVAVVVCFEHIGNATLAATNIFIQESGGWKLIHHQAGAAPAPNRSSGDEFKPVQ